MSQVTEVSNEVVEYVMRVELPSSSAYHASPSGDTEFEGDFRRAILDRLPPGFEVSWKTQRSWPKDQDGMTWVKLYCTDPNRAVEHYQRIARELSDELLRVRLLAKQIVK